MTDPELQLQRLRERVDTREGMCLCRATPAVHYEAGCLSILCWRCRERGLHPHGVCVPDFDPPAVWNRWMDMITF